MHFIDIPTGDFNYLILYHPNLATMNPETNYVQEYADYRNQLQGGTYKVALINVELLYDVFALWNSYIHWELKTL